ncbi:MAG TPA: hypothetical protein VGH81_13855 [Rudaea sp.]
MQVNFAWSNAVKFWPWVGDYYADGWINRRRLLILGESHYDARKEWIDKSVEDQRNITIETVKEWLNPAEDFFPNDFYGKLHRALTDRKNPSERAVRGQWHRIAYANYVQEIVGLEGRARKTKRHWVSGIGAFVEVLRSLRPNLVLVLGKANWDNIDCGFKVDQIKIGNTERSVYHFPWDTPKGDGAHASWVYHPTSSKHSDDDLKSMLRLLAERAQCS